MKILFDQNLSHRLVSLLDREFPCSTHVRNRQLDLLAFEADLTASFLVLG